MRIISFQRARKFDSQKFLPDLWFDYSDSAALSFKIIQRIVLVSFFFSCVVECFASLCCAPVWHCGALHPKLFYTDGILWIQLLYTFRVYITRDFSSSNIWRVSLKQEIITSMCLLSNWEYKEHCEINVENDLWVGTYHSTPLNTIKTLQIMK